MNGHVVREVFLFLVVDGDGDEALCAHAIEGKRLTFMPLLATDAERFEACVPLAQEIATQMGVRIHVVRLSERQELGKILPGGDGLLTVAKA